MRAWSGSSAVPLVLGAGGRDRLASAKVQAGAAGAQSCLVGLPGGRNPTPRRYSCVSLLALGGIT